MESILHTSCLLAGGGWHGAYGVTDLGPSIQRGKGMQVIVSMDLKQRQKFRGDAQQPAGLPPTLHVWPGRWGWNQVTTGETRVVQVSLLAQPESPLA